MAKRSIAWVALVSLLVVSPVARAEGEGDEVAHWKELTAGQSRIQFYGFLRLDLIYDDSRPDSSQIPFFILSEDPSLGIAGQENFTMHPRLTRFGVNYLGPHVKALGDAALGGKLELDFQNGGRESRAIVRIRHAYLKLSWNQLSMLAGQTWDLISPLYPTVNNDTLMWNAGNLGDRRAQLRLSWEPQAGQSTFSLAGALGLTGAVDAKDLDNNGIRDGEASGKPNAQGRIGWSRAVQYSKTRLGFGISAHYAKEKTATPVAGEDDFASHSLDLDFQAPIFSRLTLQGEAWRGSNLSDFRGGVGQGVNAATGEEIHGHGGWAELGVKATSVYSLFGGYTLDDPKDEDAPAGGRVRNRSWYLVNRFQTDGPFLVGFDYVRWITDFKGLDRGTDNRFNVYLQYGY